MKQMLRNCQEDSASEATLLDREPENKNETVSEIAVDENVEQAIKARAVAETAEEAAHLAIERAVDLEEYLEQVGSARHLLQELERLQIEADQATELAREAEEAARVAERLTDPVQEVAQQENVARDEKQVEPPIEMDTNDTSQVTSGGPSPLEIAQVEEIAEEEDDLETVAAMIIADAAASQRPRLKL